MAKAWIHVLQEYVTDTGFAKAFNVGEFWTDLRCALHLRFVAPCVLNPTSVGPSLTATVS